jgi:hypothetical protein
MSPGNDRIGLPVLVGQYQSQPSPGNKELKIESSLELYQKDEKM